MHFEIQARVETLFQELWPLKMIVTAQVET